jgi:nucleotide-binding universal stress UspA family protein
MSGIYFAYDASLHGDWIARYAVRMAAHASPRVLNLLHVRAATSDDPAAESRLAAISQHCRREGVVCEARSLPPAASLAAALQHEVPAGEGSFLICGTRRGERGRSGGGGKLAEEMLRSGHCHVLAMHVVSPGLLGLPRNVLLPIAGRPRGLNSGILWLELLGPDATQLRILHVAQVGRRRWRHLTPCAVESLRRAGQAACDRIEHELQRRLRGTPCVAESQAVVSDDIAREVVLTANRTHTRLILLGASERSLSARLATLSPIDGVLRTASCDVGIYRGPP